MAEIFCGLLAMVLDRLQCPEDFREDFTPHNMLLWSDCRPIPMQINDQAMLPTVMQACEHAWKTRRSGHAPAACMHAHMMSNGSCMGLHDMLGSLLPPKTCQQLGRVCAMMR